MKVTPPVSAELSDAADCGRIKLSHKAKAEDAVMMAEKFGKAVLSL